ncbi:MAG: hypothetical protein SGJ09_04650 [Phycisphaerae bacterium]|nr:hypothetical protein [Phycisphaerae bacterium]
MSNIRALILTTGLRFGLACSLTLGPAWAGSAFAQQSATPPVAETAPKASADPYTRVRDDAGSLVLELASRAFVPIKGNGPRITLVSAVHVADSSYYTAMQALLDAEDLVLFEGVRPPGSGSIAPNATDAERIAATRGRLGFLKGMIEAHRQRDGAFPADFSDLVEHAGKRWKGVIEGSRCDAWGHAIRFERIPAGEGTKSPAHIVLTSDGPDGAAQPMEGDDLRVTIDIDAATSDGKSKPAAKGGGIQTKLAKALGLTFQLDAMDSSKANWQSSDMSIDQLEAKFAESGADASMLLGMLDGSSLLGKLAGLLLDMMGTSPEMQAMAKMLLVETLGAAEGAPGGLGAGAMGASLDKLMKVILLERNAVVMKDLSAVIADRKDVKSVAVFYGAGHMHDLERRLSEELGYRPDETTWTAAMRVNPRDAGYTPQQAKALRETMKKMMNRGAKN